MAISYPPLLGTVPIRVILHVKRVPKARSSSTRGTLISRRVLEHPRRRKSFERI